MYFFTGLLGACGDGGIIVTDNEDLAQQCQLLRNHGLRTRDECVLFGHNSRLDALQAVILNTKLKKLNKWTLRRRQIAQYYHEAFTDLPLELPIEREGEYAVYHAYVIRTVMRDKLCEFLIKNGIDCKIHYPIPIHKQEAFIQKYGEVNLPETERQSRQILSLPVSHVLSDDQVEFTVEVVRKFFKSRNECKNGGVKYESGNAVEATS
ncbi:DegT/DnrJ/EryC1/StrS aminotransferase family protein [Geobacillus sp. C56-T3]|uniref:DegT/DnrJ/EryC1/StrS family aminotransferase n=1 Tax=Geobacillus sp. (strain C56-T3) TaxID=691437 RepID=UPI0018775C94|nr:DegT/DnrJ/EryC1/StrS family aminotransferase [Geobacillus sp. C56-T3]